MGIQSHPIWGGPLVSAALENVRVLAELLNLRPARSVNAVTVQDHPDIFCRAKRDALKEQCHGKASSVVRNHELKSGNFTPDSQVCCLVTGISALTSKTAAILNPCLVAYHRNFTGDPPVKIAFLEFTCDKAPKLADRRGSVEAVWSKRVDRALTTCQ